MVFDEYATRWRESLQGVAQVADYGVVVEGGREYALLSASSPGEKVVVITAGFHGDEKAGPMSLLEHGAEIVEYARGRGVGVHLYPCVNPSGFEAHTRYNVGGQKPNNDFMRYEVAPGVWRGELHAGETPLGWKPFDGGPRETVALAREIARLPPPGAALDLHQVNFIHGNVFYSYVFGDLTPYRLLQARSGALLPVLRNGLVDSGYEPGSDVHADAEGFIVCHDGSITDHFHRAGVPYTAAIETTTDTPWERADEINMIWVRGFVDLVGGAG